MLILFWKKQDDHHCFMLSLHGDELGCDVYLSTKRQWPFTVISEQNDNENDFQVQGVPTIRGNIVEFYLTWLQLTWGWVGWVSSWPVPNL